MAFKMKGFPKQKGIITTGTQKRQAEAEQEFKTVDELLSRQNILSTSGQTSWDIGLSRGPRATPTDSQGNPGESIAQVRDDIAARKVEDY